MWIAQKVNTATGTSTITSQAPWVNLVTPMISVTMPVITAPTPLMTAERRHPRSRSRRQCTTMPACERVKLVNTPTAYSGISFSTLPLNTSSSTIATTDRAIIPLVKANLSPRYWNTLGA